MVATDRTSAYDVVLPTLIPEKGAVLNQISAFWFEQTSEIVPNHMISLGTDQSTVAISQEIARRSMVVRKAQRIDVECVVRGYIAGSAWAEYRREGSVSGVPMPDKLKEGDKFPEPLFTPATKAEVGHDENITLSQMEDMLGREMTEKLRQFTIQIYVSARDLAMERGIIIADTKMEFGIIHDEITLIDELLTPDSSRFWDATGYIPGKSQPNFDKQFVRDWLDEHGWDHDPPAPSLPEDVILRTSQRYQDAFRKLTGETLI